MAGRPLVDLDLLFPYYSPNAPDLGCFLNRKHELESYNFFVFGEPAPWTGPGTILTHQTYARVICGDAAFYQRARATMLPAGTQPNIAIGSPGDFVLGGEFRPIPSDWVKWPVQTLDRIYYFVGEHSNPASPGWRRDAKVGHTFDIYERGTLSTVFFDDAGGDGDMNDFILEVAVVRRRRLIDVVETAGIAALIRDFEEGEYPKLAEAIRADRQSAAEDNRKAGA